MNEVTIEVPEVAPGLNRMLRLHWASRRKMLEKWKWIIFTEVYARGGPLAMPKGFVTVRITRRYHRVPLDRDNLYGSAKIILDAMKHAGLIVDDSPANIALTCEQEQGSAQTTIRVTPISALHNPGSSSSEPVSC